MTNEEKAKSLWYHFCTEKHCAEITQNCQKCPKVQVHPQLLEMAAWKEEQMVEKAFGAMREIYETYGYIPENSKEEFEQIIRRNHE